MEPTLLLVQILPLAAGICWTIGKMPCWQTWQGYVALLVVAPVAIAAGVPWLEVGVDCAELAAGFACARR